MALAVHRDSDAIDRSNWRVIVPAMLAEYPDDTAVERMSHWAVGWTDYLLVRPETPAAVRAQEWRERLADYPAADEEDYAELEYAEEWCIRCDRGTRADHDDGAAGVCRKFRDQSDADELAYLWRARRQYWGDRGHVVGSITCDCDAPESHTPSITYPAP